MELATFRIGLSGPLNSGAGWSRCSRLDPHVHSKQSIVIHPNKYSISPSCNKVKNERGPIKKKKKNSKTNVCIGEFESTLSLVTRFLVGDPTPV